MAEKKMTRKEALEAAIYLVKLAADETINTDNAANWNEAAEVLGKMYASITKPRVKSNAPSKARIENEKLAAAAVEAIREHGEPVTCKWITEHVRGILTPQKATAVMKLAIDAGEVTREKNGKVVTYAA